MSQSSPMSRRRLLRLGGGTAAAVGLSLVAGSPADAAPSAVTWPIVANGWSGALTFNGRNSFGPSFGQASAWDVRGGIHGTAFGDPALFFGWGFGGLTFVRLCDVRANLFQVYRTTKVLPDNSIDGTFYHYTYNPNIQRYAVTGPWPWHATYNGAPWNLPFSSTSFQTLGVSGFDLRVFRNAYMWESFVHHRRKVDVGDQRHFWGSAFDNAIVGWTEQYHFYPFSDAPTVAAATPGYAFIRPLDTSFGVFQVYRGRGSALRFTDNPAYVHYQHSWTSGTEALPAVNIEASGYQNPFTSWRSAHTYHYYA